MRSVGGYSVRSAWRSIGETNHVPTAGGNSHSTSRIIAEVSTIIYCSKPLFSLGNRAPCEVL